MALEVDISNLINTTLFIFSRSVRIQCPNHPDAILVEDYHAGDMICPECGLVVGDR